MATQKTIEVATHYFPELAAGGFTRLDGVVHFYTRVNALLAPDQTLVDLGAGRGVFQLDPVPYRKALRTFRGKVAKVVGIDVDDAVLSNEGMDEAYVIEPTGRYPLEDASVDVVVSASTFEHIAHPEHTAAELARVVKPGGWVCAITPNKWGYIGIGARAVPNLLHTGFLKRLQPHRQAEDVFPTTYLMNTRKDLERWFPADQWELAAYTITGEPAYFGANRMAWSLALTFLNRAPRPLGATWLVFARRR